MLLVLELLLLELHVFFGPLFSSETVKRGSVHFPGLVVYAADEKTAFLILIFNVVIFCCWHWAHSCGSLRLHLSQEHRGPLAGGLHFF